MLRRYLIPLIAILLLASCSKDDNLTQAVDGFWQLTEMWEHDVVEYHDDIYYGFQNLLIQIEKVNRGIENNTLIYRGRYWCEGDSIFFPLYSSGTTVHNSLWLEPYIGEEYVNKFKIVTFDGTQMIWTRGDSVRFVFRKY